MTASSPGRSRATSACSAAVSDSAASQRLALEERHSLLTRPGA